MTDASGTKCDVSFFSFILHKSLLTNNDYYMPLLRRLREPMFVAVFSVI